MAGLQNDEALFAVPLYQGMTRDLRLFHHNIQLMVMSYVGTLKTFLWAPILRGLGSSIWSIRMPAVLVGALTIYLFHRLLRIAGISRAVAAVCAGLLATDPVFLLTNTFDWGPVVLEHFFVVGACLSVVMWTKGRGNYLLSLGFFLLGLALWNKAIFLWGLGGLVIASGMVFWREISTLVSRKRLTLAVISFLAGMSPFLYYNLEHRNATLRENAHLDPPSVALSKWVVVKNTANGDGLFGFIVEEEWNEHPKTVGSRLGRASLWIREHAGERRESGLYWVYLAILLAVPLWWRSRMAWFSVIFCGVAWAAMAFTRDAGGSLHHTILLWPFPLLLMAAVLSRIPPGSRPGAGLPWRPVLAVAAVLMMGSNVLVLNQYLAQFEQFGPGRDFTDALFPLAQAVPEGSNVYVMDWGMYNTLLLSHRRDGLLHTGNEPFMEDAMAEVQLKQALTMLDDRDAVFVGHVPGKEYFQGVGARLERFGATKGLRKEVTQVVNDSNGRPMFELFRFRCDTLPCLRSTP